MDVNDLKFIVEFKDGTTAEAIGQWHEDVIEEVLSFHPNKSADDVERVRRGEFSTTVIGSCTEKSFACLKQMVQDKANMVVVTKDGLAVLRVTHEWGMKKEAVKLIMEEAGIEVVDEYTV